VQQNGLKLQLQQQNGMTWLYNLNEDPTEKINLSESMPEKLAELTEVLYELDNGMVEPLWPALSGACNRGPYSSSTAGGRA